MSARAALAAIAIAGPVDQHVGRLTNRTAWTIDLRATRPSSSCAGGGLYVCGGIAAKLAARFAEGDFIDAFRYKGRHSALAASIPVRVITNESLGLVGAAFAAMEEMPD